MALHGHLDGADSDLVRGWARDDDAPDAPVGLVVFADGRPLGRCLADLRRPDLEAAGLGHGRHGFEFRFDPPLCPLAHHAIAVRREGDGTHLTGSPADVEPAAAFDEPTRTGIAHILAEAAGLDEAALAERLAFVTSLADSLRRRRAEARCWAPTLQARHRGELGEPPRPRALVIDDHLPEPTRDAGSNAVVSHVRSLRRLGYDVAFAPADLTGDSAALVAEGIGCCLSPWYASVEEVLTRHRDAFALVYLHRVSTAARYAQIARETQPKARLVYSVADLHHLRAARQAEVEGRPELAAYAERLRFLELTAARQADAVITHSTHEAVLLGHQVHPGKVYVVPWAVPVRPTAAPFAERRGLAFVGNYDHQPNVDAARWLVETVMPAVTATDAGLMCELVGAGLPANLLALGGGAIDPVGHVPDLAAVFDRVRLTVAPLAYGAGVKGKVLDSLAAGVPCVCTPVAEEGLDLPGPLLRLVAGTAEGLARSILALHADEGLNCACAEAGVAYVAAMNSEARVDAAMRAAAGLSEAGPGARTAPV